jgi:hypothetical protein
VSPAALLRLLIAAEISLALGAGVFETAVPDVLPPLLEHYVERRAEEPMTQLEILALAIIIPGMFSWIGLWQLRPWGRQLYTAASIAAVLLTPFLGPSVLSATGGLLSDLSVACAGAILVLIWYSPLRDAFSSASSSSDTPA